MAEAPSSPSTLHKSLLPNVSDLPNAMVDVRCDVTGSDQLVTAAEFELLEVKPGWNRILRIARPGVRLESDDHETSEKATQNHFQVDNYSIGLYRSLDAGPVAFGPILGLRRDPGQNGGRSGIEIGLYYVNHFIPRMCDLWNLTSIHHQASRSTPAYIMGQVVSKMWEVINLQSTELSRNSVHSRVDKNIVVSIDIILDLLDKLSMMFVYRTRTRSAYDSVLGHILSIRFDPPHHPESHPDRIRDGLCIILQLRLTVLNMVNQIVVCNVPHLRGSSKWVYITCRVIQKLLTTSIDNLGASRNQGRVPMSATRKPTRKLCYRRFRFLIRKLNAVAREFCCKASCQAQQTLRRAAAFTLAATFARHCRLNLQHDARASDRYLVLASTAPSLVTPRSTSRISLVASKVVAWLKRGKKLMVRYLKSLCSQISPRRLVL